MRGHSFFLTHDGMAVALSGRIVEEQMKWKWMKKGRKNPEEAESAFQEIADSRRPGQAQRCWNGETALVLFPRPQSPILVFSCWGTNGHKHSGITPLVSVGLDSGCRLAGSPAETLTGWSQGVSWSCTFIWSIGSPLSDWLLAESVSVQVYDRHPHFLAALGSLPCGPLLLDMWLTSRWASPLRDHLIS